MGNKDIFHHGIKGQKWGVRNGPPYPLKDRRSRGSAKVDESKTSNIPNCKKLTNYKGPMYFISTSNMDNKTLEPRVVDNYFTRNGYEDNTTKRVSFAPSVNRCLMGLSQDVSNKDFYVYEPSDRSNLDIYKPNPKAVPDSSVTGELWVTTPVKLKRVGKIHCTGDDGKEGKKFNYGTHTAELYGWNFEWIADRKNTVDRTLTCREVERMNYVGYEQNTINDVMHYGRLGMKWYKHIYTSAKASGNSSKAASATSKMNKYYHKGVMKMQKLDAKAKRYETKGQRKLKSAILTGSRTREKRSLRKASRFDAKSYKKYNKQNKIARKLVDVYSDVPISDMNSSDIAYVKKTLTTSAHYKEIMLERASSAKSGMHVANMDVTY